MRARLSALVLVSFAAASLVGCSSNSSNMMPTSGTVPVGVTIKDTPPTGVTVLSFEIEVTGASLQPANSGQPAVSLISKPDDIELEDLQTTSALLNTAGVAPGTYNSLTLTFANPELTIQNNSTQTFTVGSKSCAPGQICELQPSLNPASLTISSSPFPLTLTAGMPMQLALDFNVNSSIQSDLSVVPTVSVTATALPQQRSEMDGEEELSGQVTGVGTNQFTLTNNENGQSVTVNVDANTQFEDFGNIGCTADNFSCIQVGQFLEVELGMMGDDQNNTTTTMLVATEVSLEDHFSEGLDGTIVSINPTGNQFQMVVEGEAPMVQSASIGNAITVTVNSGATFDVNTGILTIPSGMSFQSINDLLVGQDVEVDVVSFMGGMSGISITTDHVRLREAEFTATVSAVSAPNFTVNGLPGLFTGAGISEIQVQTSSQTEFEDITGASSLNVGDTVSVGGLLFKTTGDPVLLAEQVLKR